MQGQGTVAAPVHFPYLNVRLAITQIVLRSKMLAYRAVAAIVVNSRHFQVIIAFIVGNREELHVADDLGRQVLQDEALVLEGTHRKFQRFQPVCPGNVGEPAAVFVGRLFADTADILHHRKAQRIGIDTAVPLTIKGRLIDHAGMRLQKLDHEAFGHLAFVIQVIEQGVMPESRPTLIHDLCLALRIEVLRDLAHDAHHLALPGLEQRRVLFDEVQQVFLGFSGVTGFARHLLPRAGADRDGAPQVVDLALQMLLALLLTQPFLLGGDRVGPLVAVHAVIHQRMAGVENILYRVYAVAILTLIDVLLGKYQVIDDRAGVGPATEQVIALEKRVVAIAGMRNHQGLHGHGVLFHQIGNARIGIDHDLVGQAHLTALVVLLGMQKMFAVGPVVIAQRHAHRGIGVHHLLGSDDLNLIGIGVQPVYITGNTADFLVVFADQVEGPFRAGGDGLPGHVAILF